MKVKYQTLEVLSRNLAALRMQEEMTKAQVASKLNMSYRKYYLLEKGRLNIDLSTLARIAALYHIEIPSLLINPAYRFQISPTFRVSYQRVLDQLSELDLLYIEGFNKGNELLKTYVELQRLKININL